MSGATKVPLRARRGRGIVAGMAFGSTARRGRRATALVGLALAAVALVVPAAASAKSGDVRVTGSCGRGASSELRLRPDDGMIAVELRVERGRRGERWTVVLVHERRVAWRATRSTGSSGDLRVRRSVRDLAGADAISVRASGPAGITCQAAGVVRGRGD